MADSERLRCHGIEDREPPVPAKEVNDRDFKPFPLLKNRHLSCVRSCNVHQYDIVKNVKINLARPFLDRIEVSSIIPKCQDARVSALQL